MQILNIPLPFGILFQWFSRKERKERKDRKEMENQRLLTPIIFPEKPLLLV
jgi:hypothetical protein